MKKYFFIYKNSQNKWCHATNIKFVASHNFCRAVEKNDLLNKFNSVYCFLDKANDFFGDSDAEEFIRNTDLKEII